MFLLRPVILPLLHHAAYQVEPGVFRELHTFMAAQTGGKGRGRVEVVSFAVQVRLSELIWYNG